MKKIIFIILATIVFKPAFSQLKNTKWEGAIKGDNAQNTRLDFKKDTVILYNASDNEVIETMAFKMDGNTFTLTKISGRSDCDNTALGKYRFRIQGDSMLIKFISDACDDRSSALDTTNWTKRKSRKK